MIDELRQPAPLTLSLCLTFSHSLSLSLLFPNSPFPCRYPSSVSSASHQPPPLPSPSVSTQLPFLSSLSLSSSVGNITGNLAGASQTQSGLRHPEMEGCYWRGRRTNVSQAALFHGLSCYKTYKMEHILFNMRYTCLFFIHQICKQCLKVPRKRPTVGKNV